MGNLDGVAVAAWQDQFDQMISRIDSCFGRRDLRSRATKYIRGLLSPVQRKNSWQVAEHIGDATPHGIQRLLGRARWEADDVRDELIRYAQEHLLSQGDHGVLIVDETGFLKKGSKSVGVQRQYSGTAGRIENSQVGVFLALVGPKGRALIDRELYLPKSWCDHQDRRLEAGVPEDLNFSTKPQLALRMIERALSSGLRPRWVLGDAVYGGDSKVRRFLESRGQPYVLAVSSQQRLWQGLQQKRVDRIAQDIPADKWVRFSVAEGTKGPRLYDWAGGSFGVQTETGGLVRWLLVRRNIENPDDLAYYLCAGSPEASLHEFAVAAGQRWGIESCFEAAKQETGLDEYEVRSWQGWYRHVTLSMMALALLAVIRVKAADPEKKTTLRWSH